MPHLIVQLTDCHLFADAQAKLKGICTQEALAQVLSHVGAHVPNAARLILTGDLAHDERPETYRRLRGMLNGWLSRLRLVPGNHDNREAIREIFGSQVMAVDDRVVFDDSLNDWCLLGLDSHVPGELHGEIGSRQLDWLTRQLCDNPRPTLLFMHHPPVAVGSSWLDGIGLRDAPQLSEVVARHPHIRGILTGHVHQEQQLRCGETPVLTTPSTSVQFQPGATVLAIDEQPPGFRILELSDDGRWTSRVVRVPRCAGGAV